MCSSDFGMSHRGRNDVTSHEKTNHHKEMGKARSTSIPLSLDHKHNKVLLKLKHCGQYSLLSTILPF